MRSAKTSAVRYPAARKPSPPALDPAAASSGVVGPPAIGATITGLSSERMSKLIATSCNAVPGAPKVVHWIDMGISFNHTIVAAKNRAESANYFTELFGLPPAREFGPFLAVELENGVSLDFAEAPADREFHPQHYAFLVDEYDFDAIYGRILERGQQHWADPRGEGVNQI